MKTILEELCELTQGFDNVFSRKRSALRGARLLIGNLLCMGQHWVTRILSSVGHDTGDWSSNYRLFSRSKWQLRDLFSVIVKKSQEFYSNDLPIVIAGDETKVKRQGCRVKRAHWTRDAMSPPFSVNFCKAISFLQFSSVLPLHISHDVSARALPISFEPVVRPRKPKKTAPEPEQQEYKKLCKELNMCKQAVAQMKILREQYDECGYKDKEILYALDGGFCNRTIFGETIERTNILARCRKDAVLCFPATDPERPRLYYSATKFTPQNVYDDKSIEWQTAEIFYGGQKREVRFKDIKNVLWQGGAKKQPLRLIVVAPTGYRLSPLAKKSYRAPAFLLTNDIKNPPQFLLQAYMDRWQIEVNHRDEKQLFGVQHPQVWNDLSVDRIHAFYVASYSLLILAAMRAFGPTRTDQYIQPPPWQRPRRRPSALDILNLLRKEASQHPELLEPLGIRYSTENIIQKMAA